MLIILLAGPFFKGIVLFSFYASTWTFTLQSILLVCCLCYVGSPFYEGSVAIFLHFSLPFRTIIWYNKITSLGCGVERAVRVRFLEKSRLMLVMCVLHMKLGQCLTEHYHCVSDLTCQHVGRLFWFQNVPYPMVAGRVQYYWHHCVSSRKLTSSYCWDCWLPSQSLWECFFSWRATLLSPWNH